jgi:hypothetical protein
MLSKMVSLEFIMSGAEVSRKMKATVFAVIFRQYLLPIGSISF